MVTAVYHIDPDGLYPEVAEVDPKQSPGVFVAEYGNADLDILLLLPVYQLLDGYFCEWDGVIADAALQQPKQAKQHP